MSDQADKLRAEAKHHLRRLLGIADGASNGAAERFVDCVIGAAILEIAEITNKVAQERPHV